MKFVNLATYSLFGSLAPSPSRFLIQLYTVSHILKPGKLYNRKEPIQEWVKLNLQQTLTSGQKNFKIIRSNNYKIGNNLLCKWLQILNNNIPLIWLNLTIESLKIECKELLLKVQWQCHNFIDYHGPIKFYTTLLTTF